MIFYEPSILIWLKKMFNHAENKQWYETYHCFDIHGVISKPDYRKNGTNFKINYYPYAKETLQYLTKNRPDMILFLLTSSSKEEIKCYMRQFKKDNIHFKYVNENPEICNTKGAFGTYDKKPYFNSYWEDKSGFRPEKDWKPILKYFKKNKYKPNKKWSMKFNEDYHNDIFIEGDTVTFENYIVDIIGIYHDYATIKFDDDSTLNVLLKNLKKIDQ